VNVAIPHTDAEFDDSPSGIDVENRPCAPTYLRKGGEYIPEPHQEPVMPTITPFLWFDTQAEEAMNLYTSIFKRSKVIAVNRAQGKVMSVQFELEGQAFMALNAGPHFKFTEAISFFVGCENQAEIDELWARLIADGGAPSRCGWLKDKFGLSWQIIPNALGRMLSDKDAARSQRVMNAMLQMDKLDVKRLQQAYEGR
jgi:predicted 3-demethylubiquinone-9 3-methyltransferase (glyoxalase superfamily)